MLTCLISFVPLIKQGLPQPQADHALRMARFACDCLVEMAKVTERMAPQLGDDTKDLDLRVGLNSGPVTAGVLRGQKARFQLFGDTVNTAARMESNGQRARVHVSESTANLLEAAGKGEWVTKREDQIEAKGKGLMTTYGVNATVSPGSATTLSMLSSESRDDDSEIVGMKNVTEC